MKPFVSPVLTEESLQEGKLDVLVEIAATTPIRRVLSNEQNVTWPPGSGTTWYPDSGAFSVVSENLDGKRPQVSLALQNVRDPETDAEKPWTTWLNANDPNGIEVKLYFVATDSGDTAAQREERRWYISGVNELTHDSVRFHLGSPHDALAAVVPRLSLAGRKCMAAYKSGFCTSVSTFAKCPHTWPACDERYGPGQVRKFGPGFPLFVDGRRRGVA